MKTIFAVDNGDARMNILKKLLSEDGKTVVGIDDAKDAADGGASIAYCFSPAKRWAAGEIERLSDNGAIAAGKLGYDRIRLLNEKNIRYINVLADEEFTVRNAAFTAEATLGVIISETDKSLSEQRLLITGYGRLAQAIAKLFYGAKINLAIAADNRAERAHALLFCDKTYDMHTDLSDFDVIINTIPAEIFKESDLATLKKGSLYLELASVRSVSEEAVTKYGARFLEERGLPAKYSPYSSARLLKDTILRLL